MSTFVYIAGQEGGTTKTTTAHLLALGAILKGHPSAYVLTDPNRKVRAKGRPYGVLDGRDQGRLAQIISANQDSFNGWLIVDGGGNRPAMDDALAGEADLCIVPFRPSEEDLDTVAQGLLRMTHAMAWPSAWPTNRHAMRAAQYLIDGLDQAFPGRVITTPIHFVNSISELLGETLDSPSSPVRNAARKAFSTLADCIA